MCGRPENTVDIGAWTALGWLRSIGIRLQNTDPVLVAKLVVQEAAMADIME